MLDILGAVDANRIGSVRDLLLPQAANGGNVTWGKDDRAHRWGRNCDLPQTYRWQPAFVDLDHILNALMVPGCSVPQPFDDPNSLTV